MSADNKAAATTVGAHLKWVLGALLLPFAGGAAAYLWLDRHPSGIDVDLIKLTREATPELPVPTTVEPNARATLGQTVEFVVRRNDTMERIFRQLQLDLRDLSKIRELPEMRRALDMLKPGDPITFVHDATGSVQSISRQINPTSKLQVVRDAEGFHSETVATPVDIEPVVVEGSVETSLFASARKAGLSADVIMRLANDIFGWDIDFALDIQRGDRFRVLYEKQFRNGEYLGDGDILAAEFINDGTVFRAIRYQSPDGEISNYFTPEGRSMRKQFLRAPVDFTRISSGFSLARFHPLLNKVRAHKGVDYAAATGTPVKAAGDGKIQMAGSQNGYGNVVIIDHGAGITTVYGHLSRFGSYRVGTRVKQGDIVGYVGMTGLATGPHLHYEYRVNGVFKDPRSVPLPNAAPIPAAYAGDFKAKSAQLLTSLSKPTSGASLATASPVTAPKPRPN